MFAFLLRDSIRKDVKSGSLDDLIEQAIQHVKEITRSDYVVLTVWDKESNTFRLHKYISKGGLVIPPAKPGSSSIGICMSCEKLIRGTAGEFPGTDSNVSEAIGEVMCTPIAVPSRFIVGAVGIAKEKGKEPFTSDDEISLKAAGNLLSVMVSLKMAQDSLKRERQLVKSMLKVLQSVPVIKDAQERLDVMLSIIAELFDADFSMIGMLDEKGRKVKPVCFLGFEEEPPSIPFGRGLMGVTAVEKRPRLFREFPKAVPEGYEYHSQVIGSAMSTPIVVEGKMKFILVLARKKDKTPFSREEFHFLRMFREVLNIMFTLEEYEERREKMERLKNRMDRLKAIGTMAGGVSHDFNNIIGIIMGYAQLGYSNAKDEQSKRFFDIICRQCSHAANLTKQILAISREQPEQKRVIDMKPFVKGMRKLLRTMLPESIEIRYEDDGSRSYNVEGDPTQLHTAILNLASNAKDAMPEGGVFTLRLRKADLLSSLKGGTGRSVVLEVEDTGKGIDPEVIDRIFDPFFTTKEPGKGTGLGLSQVYQAVHSMGGVVDVESIPGKMTRFSLFFPEVAEDGEIHEASPVGFKRLEGKALVVEDNEDLLDLIKNFLTEMGMEVLAFNDPRTALEVLEKEGEHLEYLITDVVMPGLSGIELAKGFRSKNSGLKVIFMTGYTDRVSELEDYAQRIGAAILRKPFNIAQLAEVIGTKGQG